MDIIPALILWRCIAVSYTHLALGVFGKKVFKVDKEDVKEIIEKEEVDELGK